jgi:hypothetical protein
VVCSLNATHSFPYRLGSSWPSVSIFLGLHSSYSKMHLSSYVNLSSYSKMHLSSYVNLSSYSKMHLSSYVNLSSYSKMHLSTYVNLSSYVNFSSYVNLSSSYVNLLLGVILCETSAFPAGRTACSSETSSGTQVKNEISKNNGRFHVISLPGSEFEGYPLPSN